MDNTYTIKSTSVQSAIVSDISLRSAGEDALRLTQRIVRSEIVENPKDPHATVRICLIHQRRSSPSSPWQDCDSYDLRTLKAGEQVRLELDSMETLALFRELQNLYAIGAEGVSYGERQLVVVDAEDARMLTEEARDLLRQLMDEGDEFWQAIRQIQPGILEKIATAEMIEKRRDAVRTFCGQMNAEDWYRWDEGEWEAFFIKNKWIFGHGLAYCFLSEVQNQPYYGGKGLSGRGGQKGDFLMATTANAKFTVLVEMKTPETPLVGKEYRNKVYHLSQDLVAAVAQLQSNCRTWAEDGSCNPDTAVDLARESIHTCQPRGILVIGDTSTLDDHDKAATFELFRRNLHNPEIVTYDELLQRAEYLVDGLETPLQDADRA